MRVATTVLAAAAFVAAVAATPARAATPDPVALAAQIAAPWPALQTAAGSFPDYMDARPSPARDKYGVAALGYGLLQTGVRTGNAALAEAGVRALSRSAANPRPYHSIAFEKAALAAGWNLARAAVPGSPALAAGAPVWAARLSGQRPTWIGQNRKSYFNQFLVDAVTLLELARAGLPPGAAGTVSRDPAAARRAVAGLIGTGLPRIAGAQATRTRAGVVAMALDSALPYHALTLGYLARSIELLGPAAPNRARRLLDRYARASWLLTAPDGDLAWFGRSHQEAWALSLTAYGMEVAARGAGTTWAGRYRAVAAAALSRLAARHTGGSYGLHLTPAFARDAGAGIVSADDYVSGPAYTGLTLQALGWLAERPAAGAAGSLSRGGAATLGRGSNAFAVAQTGRVWFAVRSRPGSTGDLRNAAGLVALKVRDTRGRWRDAMPQQPRTTARSDTAGPTVAGAFPFGKAVRPGAGPSIRWDVEFRVPGGSFRRVRHALVVVRPTRCGVRFRVPARRRQRSGLSVFFGASPPPVRASKRVIVQGNSRVAYRGAGHITTGGAYYSANDGRLVRSRISARGPMTVSIESRGRC